MRRLLLLELVRVSAVIGVVVVHILQMPSIGLKGGGFFGIPGFYYVSIGGLSVTVLILLSGLVLGLKYTKVKDYWVFVKKRCLRLYPTYYMLLAVSLVLYLVRSHYGWPLSEPLTWSDLPLALSATYAFAGQWGGSIMPTSWFLGLIVTLYALFPFIESSLRKRPTSLILFLLASVVSRVVLGHSDILPGRPLDWFPLCRIFEFALGVYLAQTLPRSFWAVLDRDGLVSKKISYLAALSFPVYLIHLPVIYTVAEMPIPAILKIGLILGVSMLISIVALEVDSRLVTPYFRQMTSRRVDLSHLTSNK